VEISSERFKCNHIYDIPTIIFLVLELYGIGMVVGVQDVDGIEVVVQGFVAVGEGGSDGQAQLAQNGLVSLQSVVVLMGLRANAVVTAKNR